MRAITRYKTALKTIKDLNPKPIKLAFKNKSFDGFKFTEDRNDNIDDGYGSEECNGDFLLIKCLPEDIPFLSEPFDGENHDLYPACHGIDFTFIELWDKILKEDVIEDWGKSEWKAYEKRQKNPDFELIFVNEN